MGTSHGDFIKYPRTPHLFGSRARIELVYVEPPFDRLLQQNKRRDKAVPEDIVRKLADKCEPPTWTEAHSLVLSDGQQTE